MSDHIQMCQTMSGHVRLYLDIISIIQYLHSIYKYELNTQVVCSEGIIVVGHWTFEDQLICQSDHTMFGSDIKDSSKDPGRCTGHCS